jgi:hypothetical protein
MGMIDSYAVKQLEEICVTLEKGPVGPFAGKIPFVSVVSGRLVAHLNGCGTDEELEYATKEIHKRCLIYEALLRGEQNWSWPEEYKGENGLEFVKAEIITFVEGWLETIGQAAS